MFFIHHKLCLNFIMTLSVYQHLLILRHALESISFGMECLLVLTLAQTLLKVMAQDVHTLISRALWLEFGTMATAQTTWMLLVIKK